jgi:predicted transcriptional regulator
MARSSGIKRGEQKTVHVPLSRELKNRLDEMATKDRRKLTDFIRILIEEEWKRRSIAELSTSAA